MNNYKSVIMNCLRFFLLAWRMAWCVRQAGVLYNAVEPFDELQAAFNILILYTELTIMSTLESSRLKEKKKKKNI